VTLIAACVLAGLVSAAVFVLARRQASAQVLPIGAERPGGPHRRIPARAFYLGALALVTALCGLLVWTVNGGTSHPPDLPGETVIVIDMSGSITQQGNLMIARTLNGFRNYPPDRHAAIVYFSSSAAVGSPPSSPAADLSGLSRLFDPKATRTRGPWAASFDGGTIISRATALARDVLLNAHSGHGRVVLISDLQDNPKDLTRLHEQLLRLKAVGASLTLMPLPPTRQSPVALAQLSLPYRAVFGDGIIVAKPNLVAGTHGRPPELVSLLRARRPGLALLLALVLGAVALAAGFFPRLAWRFG